MNEAFDDYINALRKLVGGKFWTEECIGIFWYLTESYESDDAEGDFTLRCVRERVQSWQ